MTKGVWGILGIEPTDSERDIKRAYAKKLKVTRPEDDPAGFQELHNAFKTALMIAQNEAYVPPIPAAPPANRMEITYEDGQTLTFENAESARNQGLELELEEAVGEVVLLIAVLADAHCLEMLIALTISIGPAFDATIHFAFKYFRFRYFGRTRKHALEKMYFYSGIPVIIGSIILITVFAMLYFTQFMPSCSSRATIFGLFCGRFHPWDFPGEKNFNPAPPD